MTALLIILQGLCVFLNGSAAVLYAASGHPLLAGLYFIVMAIWAVVLGLTLGDLD